MSKALEASTSVRRAPSFMGDRDDDDTWLDLIDQPVGEALQREASDPLRYTRCDPRGADPRVLIEERRRGGDRIEESTPEALSSIVVPGGDLTKLELSVALERSHGGERARSASAATRRVSSNAQADSTSEAGSSGVGSRLSARRRARSARCGSGSSRDSFSRAFELRMGGA